MEWGLQSRGLDYIYSAKVIYDAWLQVDVVVGGRR